MCSEVEARPIPWLDVQPPEQQGRGVVALWVAQAKAEVPVQEGMWVSQAKAPTRQPAEVPVDEGLWASPAKLRHCRPKAGPPQWLGA